MNDLFTPNRTLSKSATQILVVGQIVFALFVWSVSPFIYLPRPLEVLQSFAELWRAGLGGELITSLTLNAEAITLSIVISMLLAFASRIPFFKPFVVMVGKLRFLSMAGLAFMFTLMASSGQELKVYLLTFSVSVFFVTAEMDVVNNIPQEYFDLVRTLGFNEWRVLWEVVVVGQVDKAFDVLRQNAAMGWMMLTLVEGMSRSGGGVGTLLLDQNRHFHLSAVFAIQLTILVTGLGQDYLIGVLRRLFCPWADIAIAPEHGSHRGFLDAVREIWRLRVERK